MSDDIDIEEHDVMAGLAEKDVFVDLSIVKREVLDIEYAETASGAPHLNSPSPQMSHACSVEVHNADSTTDDLSEPLPTVESPVAVSLLDNIETTTTDQDISCDEYDDDYEKLKEEAKSNVPKVLLEDWGFYVNQCKSYCENCKTLFPTQNALAAHNMLLHSHLVAVEGSNMISSSVHTPNIPSATTNSSATMRGVQVIARDGDLYKCLLCHKLFRHRPSARKHYKTMHEITSTQMESDSESNVSVSSKSTNHSHRSSNKGTSNESAPNKCQLCSESFANNDLLINHLYERHFPMQSHNCEKCNCTFPTIKLLLEHRCAHVDSERIKEDRVISNSAPPLETQDPLVPKAYRCNICFSYYLTVIHTLQHMSECHKLTLSEVPREFFVDTINPMCPFCSVAFQHIQSYNRHIKLKHPEKILAKTADKNFKPELVLDNSKVDVSYKRIPNSDTSKIIKMHKGYKCSLCLKIFGNYKTAYSHRTRIHANVKKSVVVKNFEIQRTKMDPSEVPTNNKNGALLPTNVIYKCPKCIIHSTNVSDMEDHIEKHNLDIDCMNTRKCDKCNLHFTLSSIHNHLQQHSCGQNFTQIVVEKTDIFKERILHKCPECLVHFSESSLKKHRPCRDVSVKTNFCNKCNIMIESNSYFYHQRYHQRNLTDIVIVNYMHIGEPMENSERWKFYYCDKCKCYAIDTEARFVTHEQGKCLKFERDVCPSCGLMLPLPALNYHMKLHETTEGMSFRSYNFYNNVGPPGKIYPPPPLFPKCEECNIYFESLYAKRLHVCGDVISISCQYCDLRLTSRAHVFHMYYHNYSAKEMPVRCVTERGNAPVTYKSDILFFCTSCNVIVDNYDYIVRHCQMKQLNLPSSTKLCNVCDLNFDETCYDSHMRRHAKADISRCDFKIISFCEAEFFKPNWLSVFYTKGGVGNISILHDLVKQSIYKRVRFVRLHLHRNGRPDCVLYECMLCNTIVNKNSVFPHTLKYKNGSCRQQNKLKCELCNFTCIGSLSLKQHRVEFDHSEKNYRLVRFNYPEDKIYNTELIKLYRANAKTKAEAAKDFPNESPMKISTKQDKEKTTHYPDVYEKSHIPNEKRNNAATLTDRRIYKMYQCHTCSIVLQGKNSCLRHSKGSCWKKNTLRVCKKCNFPLSSCAWLKHMEYHRKFKDFKKENIVMYTFLKDGNKIKFLPRNPSIETIAEFRNEIKPMQQHQIHEEQPTRKYPFYQCRNCGTCVVSAVSARKHSFICNCKEMRKKLQKCPICGLKFYQNLSSHMQMHDHRQDMNRKTVKLIPFGDHHDTEDSDSQSDEPSLIRASTDRMSSKRRHTLYKCTVCDVCLSSKKGMESHKSQRSHSLNSSRRKCELCQCYFSSKAWNKHMMRHQAYDDYVMDNIEIISFDPNSKAVTKKETSAEYMEGVETSFENDTDVESQASMSLGSQPSDNIFKIYRCAKCGLCLNSKYNSHYHITDTNASNYRTCEICNCTFTPKSLRFHMIQHENPNYITSNIRIVEFDGKSYSRDGTCTQDSDLIDDTDQSIASSVQTNELEKENYVLFKCMECDMCIETMYDVHKHVSNSSHMKFEAKECPYCGYKFMASRLLSHEKMHRKRKDYTADNIKVIAFDQKPIAGGKLVNNVYYKEIHPGHSQTKFSEIYDEDTLFKKYIVYKCSECGIHMNTVKHIYRDHPLTRPLGTTYCCKLCGLRFPYKSFVYHNRMHGRYKDYNIKTIKVVTLSPRRDKKVPLSIKHNGDDFMELSQTDKKYVLYLCAKCNICLRSRKCINFHFDRKHRMAHGSKVCMMCGYKFSKRGWIVHNQLHKKFKDYVKENIKIVTLHSKPQHGQPIPGDVPDAASKMQRSKRQISSLGIYTLYRCVQCQLCVYTRKSAVSHEKDTSHFTEHNLSYCKYCGCKFHNKTLALHLKLHRTHKDYVLENMKFIEFGQRDVVGTSKRSGIMQNSKKFVLYRCRTCSVCLSSKKGVSIHESNGTHRRVSCYCKKCNLRFNQKSLFYHKMLHKQIKGFSIDNITIVEFGKGTVTHKDSFHNTDSEEQFETDTDDNVPGGYQSQPPTSKIVLYKCRVCDLCMTSMKNAKSHIRMNVKHTMPYGTTTCKYCGHKFNKKTILSHLLLHKKYKNCTKDAVKVIEFGDELGPLKSDSKKRKLEDSIDSSSEIVEKEAKLFKCSYGLHFLNKKSMDKHLRVCGMNDTATKQSCSKCGLEFTVESLVSHLCTHHGNSKYRYKYNIVEATRTVLYKCIKCDTHFLGQNGAKRHSMTCKGVESKKVSRQCDKCGLYFHHQMLMEHQMYHHILPKNMASYEYKIINVSDVADDTSTENHRLYKCLACAVHYHCKKSIEAHLGIPHGTKLDIKTVDCKICNLGFTPRGITMHKKIHENINVEEFEIQEFDALSKMEVAMKRHLIVNPVTTETNINTANDPTEEDDHSKVEDRVEETHVEVPSATKERKKEVSTILYKCSECDVHYLKENTVYKHTIKNHQRIHPSDIFECKHCGLNFRALTLTPHTRQHHYDNTFELKDFTIHEYEPLTRETILKNKKSTPKITIYNAADQPKNVDTSEKMDVIPEESVSKESAPIENVEKLVDSNRSTEHVSPNNQEPIDNEGKSNSDSPSEDKDCSTVNCQENLHPTKDKDLNNCVVEGEIPTSEKSIRNFIIFES